MCIKSDYEIQPAPASPVRLIPSIRCFICTRVITEREWFKAGRIVTLGHFYYHSQCYASKPRFHIDKQCIVCYEIISYHDIASFNIVRQGGTVSHLGCDRESYNESNTDHNCEECGRAITWIDLEWDRCVTIGDARYHTICWNDARPPADQSIDQPIDVNQAADESTDQPSDV